MPKIYVKDSGTWKQVLRIWVKQAGTWKGVAAGLVTSGGIGKQFYPDTISTVVYSSAGTYSYIVPAGVTQLQITYPTLTSVVTQTVSVTAGATYTVTIGAYGSGSSFGALLTAAAYTKTIGSWAGNVDSQVDTTWGVSTTAGNTTFSGTGNGNDLAADAANAGCYYTESNEGGHGDLTATISINTVQTSTLVAPLDVAVINFSGRGDSGVNITQQPTAGNSFRVVARAYDGGYSEGTQSWDLQLRQTVSLQIKALGANFQTYPTAGSYSFTVPAGVTSLTATVVGGGGGGGGSIFSGDGHGAANGGSGGFYSNQSFAVTPGETLALTVGAAGAGVSSGTGGTGGSSSINRGATNLYTATGGTGGGGCAGDNAPTFGGTGGSPSGVNGSYTASWMVNRNTPGQGYNGAGQNGTGYGNGGLGGNSTGGAAQGGTGLVGGTGYISLSW